MATVAKVKPYEAGTSLLEGWNFTGDGEGDAIFASAMGDRCATVAGTFDGATVTLQGTNSLDGEPNQDWFTLHDVFGNLLTFTSSGAATGLKVILETPYRTRAIVTGAGAGCNLRARIYARRTQR
jgi:hypothetical protein